MLAINTRRSSGAAGARYAYGSPTFTAFVAASFRKAGAGDPQVFYRWMDDRLRRVRGLSHPGWSYGWEQLLANRRQQLQRITHAAERTQRETELCAQLHRDVKATIPRFSLDRGYEFVNVVKRGERQCFLQAMLIAGLLQAAGVEAGVVMVNRNHRGVSSNNGHAVTLVKLADGKDLLVDASEAEPFARPQGLFGMDRRGSGYRYISPVYERASPLIPRYKPVSGDRPLGAGEIQGLDIRFLRSQFDYYRGERVTGGLVLGPATPRGLEAQARYLRSSVESCPRNPLAVYVLGRVYLKQGKTDLARRQFVEAYHLYQGFGWIPASPRQSFAQIPSSHVAHSR